LASDMGLSSGTGGGGIQTGRSHTNPSAREDAAPLRNITASALTATQATHETCRHTIRQSLSHGRSILTRSVKNSPEHGRF
jgi:hypothetical protein